jgi:hypothetical protein
MLSISPTGKPDSPIEEMCRNAMMRVRDDCDLCQPINKVDQDSMPALYGDQGRPKKRK